MALVDYSHDPATGLYDFRDDAGKSRMAFGAEAEELARFVDQSRGPRLAANMSGGGPAMSVDPSMQPGPAPTATDVPSGPMASGAGPVSSQPQTPPVPPTPGQVAQRVGERGPVAPPVDPLLTPEGKAQYVQNRAYKYVGGQAAFDPEAEAAARKPVPVSRTVQTEGGIAETPEQKAERIEAEKQRKAAQKSALENVRAANEARVAAAEDAKWSHLADAENKAAAIEEKRKERAQIQEHGAKGRAKLEADVQNIRSRKIDDKRIFRGKDGEINTGSVIASALAMGLGAFGAGMTGTRNFAQDLIEGAIQQDIQLQKDQIEREGDAADNALARLIRHNRFTESEATRALEMLQREQAQAKAAALAAQMGTADARAKAEQINLELMQRNEEANARFQEMYGGRQVVTERQQMMAPRAAVAPRRVLDQDAASEALDFVDKYGNVIGGRPDKDEVETQVKLSREQRDRDERVTEYGEKVREVRKAEQAAKTYVEALGGVIEPDGSVKVPEGDLPGVGPHDANVPLWSPTLGSDDRRARQAQAEFVEGVLRAETGAGATVDEVARLKQRLIGAFEEDAARGIEMGQRKIREANRRLDGSYGKEIVSKYQTQLRETDEMRARREREGAGGVVPAEGAIRLEE